MTREHERSRSKETEDRGSDSSNGESDWRNNLDKLGEFGNKLSSLLADNYDPGDYFAHGGVMAVRIEHDDPLYGLYVDGEQLDLIDISQFTNLVALYQFLGRYARARRNGAKLPWEAGEPWAAARVESEDGDLPDGRRGFQ